MAYGKSGKLINNVLKFPKRTRRSAPVSAPVTPELAAIAKALRGSYGLAQHIIAAKLNVNPGRISEVINGMRYPDVPPARPEAVRKYL